MEEFSGTLEALSEYIIIPELPLLPAFQAIQQFKSLPDFLMFPAALALRHIVLPRNSSLLRKPFAPDMDIFRAMQHFVTFANGARERSRSSSNTLKYACQYWAFHLEKAPSLWDKTLTHIFESFWNRSLLSWLERQWCLNGLRSCLVILSEGQKLAKVCISNDSFPATQHLCIQEHLYHASGSSQASV
jgi:hypothetical protein